VARVSENARPTPRVRERAITRVVLVAAITRLVLLPSSAAADEARDLVKRALAALPQVPFVATMTLTSVDGPPRELQLSYKVINGTRSSYLEVQSPADLKGARFLFLEPSAGQSQQFLTIPVSRKILQASDSVRKYSFLGSTFSVADLIQPQLDAFTYTVAGEDDLLGRRCKLIEAVPKQPARELYSKTIVAIDIKDALILKRLFLDDIGKLVKAWTVTRVEKRDGHWVLLDQLMKNLQDHKESRLQISDIQYQVDLPDSVFTPHYLAR